MEFEKGTTSILLPLFISTIIIGAFFSNFLGNTPSLENNSSKDFEMPEVVKSVYLTSWSASTERYIREIIDLAGSTEINTVVIDIKDWSGFISYDTDVTEAVEYGAERIFIKDIEKLIERFHRKEIAVIARIVVFQDSVLAEARPELAIQSKEKIEKKEKKEELKPSNLLWKDNKDLAWIDPAAPEAWDYNTALAEDAFKRGFDEVNFDYVRFPSDGNLKDMSFPVFKEKNSKHSVIKKFFENLRRKLPQKRISVDLFGLSTVNYSDLGVGQIIEDAFLYFDFVCPMVYPSHFSDGFEGYENPAQHPYQIIDHTLKIAKLRLNLFKENSNTKAKIRPWLQDFSLGTEYDKDKVRAQIKATQNALGEDFSGFMLWSSENIYTREALEKEIIEDKKVEKIIRDIETSDFSQIINFLKEIVD